MKIPTQIYRYLLITIIILTFIVGFYLYSSLELEDFNKKFLIWYIIILQINFIHFYYIIDFYEKNKNKKGPKGPKGDTGPRGNKGKNETCSSCDGAGSTNLKYGGETNDKGQNVENDMVQKGKCIFPFIDNYQYQYDCQKTTTPLGTNDANMFGWCPTQINEQKKATKFAYCNANSEILDDISKDNFLLNQRQDYISSNSGILDLTLVSGTTEEKSKEKCNKPGFQIYDQDLNEKSDGKFIYMCYKKGVGNKGISELQVSNPETSDTSERTTTVITGTTSGVVTGPTSGAELETKMTLDGFNILNSKTDKINLNEGSQGNDLYLYKKFSDSNFIKDFKIIDGSKDCSSIGENYKKVFGGEDLNEDSDDTTPKLKLCVTNVAEGITIDMAFTYKTGVLYLFRGEEFYKMIKIPVQGLLDKEEGYPKKISDRWFKTANCSEYKDSETCNQQMSCIYDNDEKSCVFKRFSAGFTYNHDKKTYFFRGTEVYLYNDKKMKIEDGYPKNISEVFSGVPDNIDAVFSWGKDKSTYFFKGPLYYKFNDKNKKVEPGYPKRSDLRWQDMPPVIDAIFTVDISLEGKSDRHPTYVISGTKSYYIDPITDKVIDEKPIDERFNIVPEDEAELSGSTTKVVGATKA